MAHSATAGSEVAPENLATFAGGFFEAAGPALTTVLNRPVSVAVVEITSLAPARLPEVAPLPWMLGAVSYQRGVKGSHWLVLDQPSARALGEALIHHAEDDDGKLGAAHQDAIREALNQLLVSVGPTLMPLFTRSVTFAPVSLSLIEDPGALPKPFDADTPTLTVVRARAQGEGGLQFDMLLTIEPEMVAEIMRLSAGQPASLARDGARAEAGPSRLDLILDIALPVTVELGRARMQIQDILKLAPGSVIELDKSAGDPVDLYIKDRPIAKGEVVVIDENFGVRLTSIVTASERIKTLR